MRKPLPPTMSPPTEPSGERSQIRLTPAQFRLLGHLIDEGPQHCVDYWPPAKALVSKNLAKWVYQHESLEVTDFGREVYAQLAV